MRNRSRLLHHTVHKISKFRAAKRQKRVKQLNNTLVKTYKLSSCALLLQFVQILQKERSKKKKFGFMGCSCEHFWKQIINIVISISVKWTLKVDTKKKEKTNFFTSRYVFWISKTVLLVHSLINATQRLFKTKWTMVFTGSALVQCPLQDYKKWLICKTTVSILCMLNEY